MSKSSEFGDTGAARVAHLQMVQAVISRMSSSSFALKALAVVLVAAIVALVGALNSPSTAHILLGIFPLLALWWLDARFLHMERRYRSLFEEICAGDDVTLFDMSVDRYKNHNAILISLSWSLSVIYLPMLAVLIGLALLINK